MSDFQDRLREELLRAIATESDGRDMVIVMSRAASGPIGCCMCAEPVEVDEKARVVLEAGGSIVCIVCSAEKYMERPDAWEPVRLDEGDE